MEVKLFYFHLYVSLSAIHLVSCQYYGVITAFTNEKTDVKKQSYCMVYNEKFQSVPKEKDKAAVLEIVDATEYNLCDDPGPNITSTVEGRAAAVSMQENCTICDLAENVEKYGANATVVLQTNSEEKRKWVNDSSDYSKVNITVAVMLEKDFHEIKKLGGDVKVQMYSPDSPRWDYDLIVIWFMAVMTVAIGAYWSGIVTHQIRQKKRAKDVTSQRQDDESVEISPLVIIILVILMCVMLLLLYFFYDYLVYVVIGLFTLACSISLYGCLLPFYEKIPCLGDCRIPPNNLPLIKRRPQIKCIILGLLCLGVGITWAVLRNAAYAWILQDILGIVFCIQMMKTIRLSSLKACTILLSLLFFYDIFFVFITPLFMPKGDSIMVHVATGGNSKSGEMLPMVLKVPRLQFSITTVCNNLPYSLLGFGDILVPGLLISYCHGFDLKVGSRKIYYIASLIAYGVGMVVTFIALALMEKGQPALLYLVPFTLITTFSIALCRKQFKMMWSGENTDKKKTDDRQPGGRKAERSESINHTTSPASPANQTGDSAQIASNHVSDTSDEEAVLLVTN